MQTGRVLCLLVDGFPSSRGYQAWRYYDCSKTGPPFEDRKREGPRRVPIIVDPEVGVIKMGSVGDGESQSDAAPWAPVAVAIAALGLAGGVAGFAVRRRAMTR